jgi:hypothetical protein
MIRLPTPMLPHRTARDQDFFGISKTNRKITALFARYN